MSLQPARRTTSQVSGLSARMLGIFFLMSSILAPGKQKVAADFRFTVLTIESPMISVVRGGVDGGENFSSNDDGDGEGRAERDGGALPSAGVNCSMEHYPLMREKCSGLAGEEIRGNSGFQGPSARRGGKSHKLRISYLFSSWMLKLVGAQEERLPLLLQAKVWPRGRPRSRWAWWPEEGPQQQLRGRQQWWQACWVEGKQNQQ